METPPLRRQRATLEQLPPFLDAETHTKVSLQTGSCNTDRGARVQESPNAHGPEDLDWETAG